MKHAKLIALVALTALIIINISSPAAAATTQWFPTSGTTIDYKYSMIYTFSNGTTANIDHFNVYGNGIQWYIEPVYFSNVDNNFSLPLIRSNVEITMRHEYKVFNSTVFNRTTSYMAGSNLTSTIYMNLLSYAANSTYSFFAYNFAPSNIIPVTGFTDIISGDILDYFNNNAGIGAMVATHYHVTAISSTTMVISYSPTGANYTYVTDAAGKVISYSEEFTINKPGFGSTELLFEAQPPATATNPLLVEWVIIASIVAIVTLVIVVNKKSRKY